MFSGPAVVREIIAVVLLVGVAAVIWYGFANIIRRLQGTPKRRK